MAAATTPAISDWESLAASKRASNLEKIPPEWRLPSDLTTRFHESSAENVLDIPSTCGILTPKELEITENYDASDLVQMMANKELSSREVTVAFCKRAAVAQQCVNCLTEICFVEAIATAEECDEFLRREGRTMGPLHGLPISLKVGQVVSQSRMLWIRCDEETDSATKSKNQDGASGRDTSVVKAGPRRLQARRIYMAQYLVATKA